MNHEVGDPAGFEQIGRSIQCITLADAAEIDLKARSAKSESLLAASSSTRCWLPTLVERLGKVGVVGHLAGAAKEAPGLRERTARDVVGATGPAMQLASEAKQLEQPRFDFDVTLGRLAIQPAHFARRAINRELIFKPIDKIERRDGHFRAVGILARVKQTPQTHRPSRAADANQIRSWSGEGGGSRTNGEIVWPVRN